MPEFKAGCTAKYPAGTHDHCCFLQPGHAGMHSCYGGVWWDEDGRIKLRRLAPRHR